MLQAPVPSCVLRQRLKIISYPEMYFRSAKRVSLAQRKADL
jgi:hypothetical protein